MGRIEAEYLVVKGRVVENASVPAPVSGWYRVVIVPGFSDGHAHPQVVDGGVLSDGPWRDSYEWIKSRRLSVDEALVRADSELAAGLARLTLWKSLLEGTTLIALTGRLEANVAAFVSSPDMPRVVLLPTVMRRQGWPSYGDVVRARRRVEPMLADGLARLGVFIHSLEYTDPGTVRRADRDAAARGEVLGLHLGEGRPELARLLRILGGKPSSRLVAVHCIDDEGMVGAGVRCVSCPATNLILYRRTRRSLRGVTSFGSDWPLLIGSVPRHLGLLTRLWPSAESVLSRATLGGYLDYGMPYGGDIVAFDEGLGKVLEGGALPRFVSVAGKPVVVEGRLATEGYSHAEVESMVVDLVKEALEKYPSGEAPATRDPLSEAQRAFHELLLLLKSKKVAAPPSA